MNGFDIAGRRVGGDAPPYVVAELSANHLGSLERALAIVDAAAQAGADAVKLQTYTPQSMTLELEGEGFSLEQGPWAGRTLYDLYAEAQTPWAWHEALFDRGRRHGMAVFSSPFDPDAVEALERIGAPAYKIASFELVDHALIACAARTGKPLILSTGMADAEEIDDAVAVARAAGCRQLALLHCVSGYPTPPEEANLQRIRSLADRWECVVGLSDHSLGAEVPVAAVALGARFIEKHLTLARSDGGPDGAFSLEPAEFAALVRSVRVSAEALGHGRFERAASEASSVACRRSLYVVRDVEAGARLVREDVRAIRPGLGLAPKHLETVIGRSVRRAIRRGEPLDWELIEGARR